MSKKTASKKAAKKNASAKKAAPPKKKVAAKKAAPAPKKKPVAKKAAPAPKKKPVAKKAAAPPRKKPVAKKAAPAPRKKPVAKIEPPRPRIVVKEAPLASKSAPTLPAPANPVKAHAWKDVSVTLDGNAYKVIFFDWEALNDATRDPSPTARYQPDRNPFVWVEEFEEHVLGNWSDPVHEGDWEPIAVVGIGHASSAETFAEANNRGFLAVVRKGGSFPASTVLWLDGPRYHRDEPFIVAPHVDALVIVRR